ncbi:MAG: S1 RNA-binding domain-containing protein [Chloroflexi bacterium]|nr:S1 RNA-binding domain-containing protein [Chloroflexota bacterium]
METTNNAPENSIQPKMRFSGKVVKTTLAGAVVDIGQTLPGVLHISQLSSEPVNRVEDVVQVGQEVVVWVRRVRKDSIELTMIEPLGLDWREILPEMIVKGKVARLETYGAFVDIGAERAGLVHVSEIAHGFVKNPAELLKEGDEVEAKVLGVDRRKKQIRLSIKATLAAPEETIKEKRSEPRKSRSKKGKSRSDESYEANEPSVPELTGMEIAWQEALARAENKKNRKGKKGKHDKKGEQEDILNRTLENRITTG